MKQLSAVNEKKIITQALIHFGAIWIILNLTTVVPYIFQSVRHGYYLFHADHTPVTYGEYFIQENIRLELLVFFIDAFLIEFTYRRLFRKVKFYRLIGVCLLIALFTLISSMINHLKYDDAISLIGYTGPMVLVSAYVVLYCWVRDYFDQRAYYQELKLQQSQNELNALKAQLNPHFFFNSLNYLYGTALKENAEETASGIDQLADMMRYSITGMQENFVPLNDELTFIKNYTDLQQKRLPVTNKIRLDIQIAEATKSLTIAPLLLLPFIENAFKYGISTDESSYVSITIGFDHNTLMMTAENSIIKNRPETAGNNTGIRNTVKRLHLLYDNKHQLKQSIENQQYHISLTLNLH